MVTAKQNITRALTHAGLGVEIVKEAEDRVYGWPSFSPLDLEDDGWTEDLECVAKLFHEGAVMSYREPGAVMPALQITFLDNGMVDVDLDLANPWGGDVACFCVHVAEVVRNWVTRKKSNQRTIAKWLDRRLGDELSEM